MSNLSLQSLPKRTLIKSLSPSDHESSTYITDMSRQDSMRARHRQRQAAYEARQRAGVALYPAPLGAVEIGALIALGWLREGAEIDRVRVGEAVAAAIRDMASRFRV